MSVALRRPAPAGLVSETRVPGEVPRFELASWREAWGIVAGVTGRQGEGDDFDLGLWSDAPVGRVMTRWRAFHRSLPGFTGWVLGNQVHGAMVVTHGPVGGWLQVPGVDGHVTSVAGVLLTVTVADCIPVYLADPVARRVALLHAGWRGTAGGILERGVEQLLAAGAVLDNLVMHCGVGICGSCYEVGSEVIEACGPAGVGPDGRHLDLRAVLTAQAAGLGIGQVSTSQMCSAHDGSRFFSHRRSRGADGRMVAYLGLIP